jgi:hypothetical protein
LKVRPNAPLNRRVIALLDTLRPETDLAVVGRHHVNGDQQRDPVAGAGNW